MGKLGTTPRRRRSTALALVVTALLAAACSLTAADDDGRDAGASSTTTVTVVPLQVLPTRGIVSPYTGRAYATQMSAVGGRPPYAWSISSGALPEGLTLAPSGLLSGTSTATGAYSYGVTVTDTKGAKRSMTLTGNMNSGATPIPFVIATFTLPAFGLNQDLGFEPAFVGGTPPYTFGATDLPAGVTMDPATGTLMGQPTTAGSFSFPLTLKDSLGNVAGGTPVTVSMSVNPPRVVPAGGGGGAGGFKCAPYDSTVPAGFQYAGIFEYKWEDSTAKPPTSGTGSFRVSFDATCLAPATNGSVVLKITKVNGSDAFFGTVGSATPKEGSVMTMPADPPTTPSNKSQPGQGVVLLFPNGATLATTNDQPGLFNVLAATSPFKIVSNPQQSAAWTLVNVTTGKAFTHGGNPNARVTGTSWNFDHL